MSYNFQKWYYTILFTLFLACTPDYDFEIAPYTIVPENLIIDEPTGIKLESHIVTNQVSINIKLPSDGTYRIKLYDFTNTLVSQERITAKAGDNLLNIYVSALPVSSYRVELYTESNFLLGREVFTIKN